MTKFHLQPNLRLFSLVLFLLLAPLEIAAQPMHGIAMHGDLKYGPNFQHFDYVNPKAPIGGELVYGEVGGFDSLNPFIIRGRPSPNLLGPVFESLMARAFDEPFSLYGLLAETVETPEDRSWVSFTLNNKARFSDGTPLTIEDVIYSFELLREKGRPFYRTRYSKVAKVERIGSNSVKFIFENNGDREMPMIMGLMPVLPKHVYLRDSFERTSLAAPVGSGPYIVDKIEPGSRITFRRNPDYWGRNLVVNAGRHNFEQVTYLFYRDENALFEDFKKGTNHVRIETDTDRWTKGYNFPAYSNGHVKKEQLPVALPAGMRALVFNTRRDIFKDIRVRKALIELFDFEWINRNLYNNLYRRTRSYFDRSELSSADMPADARERSLLAPWRSDVDPDILEHGYNPPVGDTGGHNREARAKALHLLREAGYVLRDGKLVNKKSGVPFSFQIISPRRDLERLLLTYANALERIGIDVQVRNVDSAQYQQRKTVFDFDMIAHEWWGTLSPGNEQIYRWGSQSADTNGSFNFAGIKNPAVDAMIEAILAAKKRDDFVTAVHALDRVLLSGYYVVPLFHTPRQWIAYWRQIHHPQTISLYGLRLDTLWQSPASIKRAN